MRVPFLTFNVKSKFFSSFRIPDSQKNVEKTLIWYFAVRLWWEAELLKGILKFPQNQIKVCESTEFSSRVQLTSFNSFHTLQGNRKKSSMHALSSPCHHHQAQQ